MDKNLHYFETMRSHGSSVFAGGMDSFQSFFGGAKLISQPSAVDFVWPPLGPLKVPFSGRVCRENQPESG